MKNLNKIIHFLGFHGIFDLIDTGEFEMRYITPWDIWPTKYEFYKCKVCGRITKMPPGDFDDMYWNQSIYKLKIKIANKWVKKGNYKKATEVLKI